jgi:hypothetical protein
LTFFPLQPKIIPKNSTFASARAVKSKVPYITYQPKYITIFRVTLQTAFPNS